MSAEKVTSSQEIRIIILIVGSIVVVVVEVVLVVVIIIANRTTDPLSGIKAALRGQRNTQSPNHTIQFAVRLIHTGLHKNVNRARCFGADTCTGSKRDVLGRLTAERSAPLFPGA